MILSSNISLVQLQKKKRNLKMIQRSTDADFLQRTLDQYPELVQNFDAKEWLTEGANILLRSQNNLALFEKIGNGLYEGHMFFKVRGREAITLALRMLKELEEARTVVAIIPSWNRKSQWIVRQIGFNYNGPIEKVNGPHEMFIYSRRS